MPIGKALAFEELAREVRLLFHGLRAATEGIHGGGDEVTVAHRGVLESLHRHGPQTVPALARARPVARQHIQVLVNRLLSLGLVEARVNPAHLRSPIIALTSTGAKRFERMRAREQQALARLPLRITERELREATAVLRSARETLEGLPAAPARGRRS